MNSAAPPPAGRHFRPDIEGLRGIAILLVVACHCSIPWCRGGFVGVDVFFVISGYLITSLLAAEYSATSRLDLARFFARRARRLLPACVLVLAATMLCAALLLGPRELLATGRAAGAAGLYVSNIFFDRSASDYFAADVAANPLLHTWSLGLEEQFYLVWPFLLVLAGRIVALRARQTVWILGAVALVSLAFCVCATRLAPTVAFYELPARAWEFAAGGLLTFLPVTQGANRPPWSAAAGWVGITAILVTGALLGGGGGFPGWIAAVPVAGTLAIILTGDRAPRRGVSLVLSAAPLQFIGKRSYSWYLWHWPFIVFVGVVFPGVSIGGKVLAAAAALLAATLTYGFMEHPIRESPYLRSRAGLSLRLAASATALTAGLAFALTLSAHNRMNDQALKAITAGEAEVADLSLSICVSQGMSTDPKSCVFGPADASRSVVLFGDSHALQWFNAFRAAAELQSWRLVTVLKAGCPAADFNAHPVSAASAACDEWRARAIEKLAALRPTAIVMASYAGATLRGYETEAPMPVADLNAGTRRVLEKLSRLGMPIVVLRDTPLPPFDVPACLTRDGHPDRRSNSCAFDASWSLNEPAFAAERAAAAGLASVYFLDLSDLFCRSGSCAPMRDGVLVYRDDNHVTGAFTKTLAPAVGTRLARILHSAQ